jgi:hypothetical protein
MRTLALAATAAAALFALPALAADPLVNSKPDGTLLLTAKAAAAGIGYTWGNGTLYYEGHQYPFSVKGITVADVGFAEVTGRGRVYHLNHLADFSGTYAAAIGEATVGHGIGGEILRNGNGVMIRVDEITKGARLAGSGDGIQLTLQR